MTAKQLTKQVESSEKERSANMLKHPLTCKLVKTSVKVVKKSDNQVSMTLETQPAKIDLRKAVEEKINYRTKKQSQAAESFRNLFKKG